MKALYIELGQRIRGECNELEYVIQHKISGLISKLPGLWEKLCAEMLAFADFIEELAEATKDK